MPTTDHVRNPPRPDQAYVDQLAAHLQCETADAGCQLSLPVCRYIAGAVLSWGQDLVLGHAPLVNPTDPAQLAAAQTAATRALYDAAARQGIGLRTRPQFFPLPLPKGGFVLRAAATGLPLVPPTARQTAILQGAATGGSQPDRPAHARGIVSPAATGRPASSDDTTGAPP